MNVTQPTNTHHIVLTKGSDSVGFILCDAHGRKNPLAGTTTAYPKMASKLVQGTSSYADQNPPFEDVGMSDFSGGRGNLHFDEDKTKYWDGKRIDTRTEGRVILGGQETYTSGIRNKDESWSGNVDWLSMYTGGTTDKVVSFTASADYAVSGIEFILRKVGSPVIDSISASLLDSSDNVLATKSYTGTQAGLTDFVSKRVFFEFSATYNITNGNTYKVKFHCNIGDSNNYIDIAVDGNNDPYYRVLDDTEDFDILPFEYRGALYVVTQPRNHSASSVYIFGDRGVADSNSGDLSKLNDATKTWSTNEWSGDNAIVYIINGPGSEEEQPWREITSNDGTSLTVSEDWNVVHTTDTEYVIIPKTIFNQVTVSNLSTYVTDVTVADRFVYFAQGLDDIVVRYQAYNDGGTFTERDAEEGSKYDKIMATKSASFLKERRTWSFFGTKRNVLDGFLEGAYITESKVPSYWGNLISYIGTAFPTNVPYDDLSDANLSQSLKWGYPRVGIGEAFTTGTIMRYAPSASVDLSEGYGLAFAIWSDTNDWAAGELTLELFDGTNTETIDLGAVTAGEWSWQHLALEGKGALSTADETAITKVAIATTVDKGIDIIYLWPNGFILTTNGINGYFLPYHKKVTKLIEYIGTSGQITSAPWLLCKDAIFYLESGTLKPLILKELSELQHPENGRGATVNDVYLYFNLGETIQRYYSGQLDSIGPDVGYGLPEDRRGIPVTLSSYPGMVIAGIDAGDDGYSSILYRRNHGWHEAYRAPVGKRIRDTHILGRPDSPDMLFFSEGADIAWIPISLNPETEDGYKYTYEGVLETGRIYSTMREMQKYYHAITLITEDMSSGQTIEVDFKTDGDTSWTPLGTTFNTSPRQYENLASTNDTIGHWIQLRFRMYTTSNTATPVLTAAVLDGLTRAKSNYLYSYQVFAPMGTAKNLLNQYESTTGVEKWNQINTWINEPGPITLTSVNPIENNKLVFIEPSKTGIVRYHPRGDGEIRTMSLQLLGVTPVGEE